MYWARLLLQHYGPMILG